MKPAFPFAKLMITVVLLFLVGCSSTGPRIRPDEVRRIKRGVTTRAELVKTFGIPASIEHHGETQALAWYYTQTPLWPAQIGDHASLFVAVDKSGKVLDYNYGGNIQ